MTRWLTCAVFPFVRRLLLTTFSITNRRFPATNLARITAWSTPTPSTTTTSPIIPRSTTSTPCLSLSPRSTFTRPRRRSNRILFGLTEPRGRVSCPRRRLTPRLPIKPIIITARRSCNKACLSRGPNTTNPIWSSIGESLLIRRTRRPMRPSRPPRPSRRKPWPSPNTRRLRSGTTRPRKSTEWLQRRRRRLMPQLPTRNIRRRKCTKTSNWVTAKNRTNLLKPGIRCRCRRGCGLLRVEISSTKLRPPPPPDRPTNRTGPRTWPRRRRPNPISWTNCLRSSTRNKSCWGCPSRGRTPSSMTTSSINTSTRNITQLIVLQPRLK